MTRLRVAESPCPQCYADELQYEGGYGPCVDAGRAGQMFLVDDMRTKQRWPDYAQNVAADGVLSSLSVPLPFQGVTIGALNTSRRAICPGGLMRSRQSSGKVRA